MGIEPVTSILLPHGDRQSAVTSEDAFARTQAEQLPLAHITSEPNLFITKHLGTLCQAHS